MLNDFRSRLYCYFENETDSIKGMQILPLSTRDIIKILESHISYTALLSDFETLLKSPNDWGSKWYENEIKPFIACLDSVGNKHV